jgi:hypothetical protein
LRLLPNVLGRNNVTHSKLVWVVSRAWRDPHLSNNNTTPLGTLIVTDQCASASKAESPFRRNKYEKTNSPHRRTAAQNIQRADIAPGDGYAMVVDGHFKTQFSEESAAKKAATELLARYPMLQVEIYDATTKSRARVEQGEALTTE